MTKSSRKNVPDAGFNLGTACIPSGVATDRQPDQVHLYSNSRILSLSLQISTDAAVYSQVAQNIM